jgi:hypothetical protein
MKRTTLFALVVAFAAIQSAPAEDVRAGASSSSQTLPVECEAFLNRVDRCMQTLGPDNPIASAYKQNLVVARAQWEAVPDKVLVGNVCHRASEAFDKTAANAKCEPLEVVANTR